jgi:hypothetical protein
MISQTKITTHSTLHAAGTDEIIASIRRHPCDGTQERLPCRALASRVHIIANDAIESWDDLIPTMLDLWKDPPRLRKRQQDLLAWYEGHMNNKVVEMENELTLREDQSATPF